MIIECPNCGTKCRLPDSLEPGKAYRCPQCKARLHDGLDYPPTKLESSIADFAGNYTYLYLILIIGVLSTLFHIVGNLLPYHIAYTDIAPFYEYASQPGMPYIDRFIEYPVLTGLFIHSTAALGQTKAGYFLLTSVVLVAFATAATFFLHRSVQQRGRNELYIYWIFAPSMFFFLIFNWDILAVLSVVIALYFMGKDRLCIASSLLAVGFCFKLYPVILLLPLLAKRRNINEWIKIAGVFGVVAFIINAPFIFANFEGWYYFISFNSDRPPNPDSVWAIVSALAPQLTITDINVLSLALFLASSAILMWRYRHEPVVKLCLVMTLLFLIFNKIFSPQYLLWLLPLFVLLPMRRRRLFYALEVANLLVLFVALFYVFDAPGDAGTLGVVRLFAILRHAILVYLLFNVLGWTSRVPFKYRSLHGLLARRRTPHLIARA